jgi:hypothetical protein
MNPSTEVKTNPNPAPELAIVNGGAAAATASAFSFPIGYYDLHPDVSINFQLNRFYGWVGVDSMLTEMREALAGVNDYPAFTKIVLDLGEKALAGTKCAKGPTICVSPSSSCPLATRARCPHASALSICSSTISKLRRPPIAEFLLRPAGSPPTSAATRSSSSSAGATGTLRRSKI